MNCKANLLHFIQDWYWNNFKKKRAKIADPANKFFVFCNEFHKDTWVPQDAGESINDRNDRAIRVATKWQEIRIY